MGVSCATYCETCNVEAAEIGDQGCITMQPILAPIWVEVEGDLFPTFGSVYQCLAAIHLLPVEVEEYKKFLETHHGHKIVICTDHDDFEPHIDFETLNKVTINRKSEEYIFGCYVIKNAETMECVKTSIDHFRKFDLMILKKEAIDFFHENFIERWQLMDAFYSCPPSIDPYEDLGEIISFMKRNRDSTLEIYIEPESL